MDFLEALKKIPDNAVDMILIDPPYNINYYSNHGNKEYKERVQTAREWDSGDFDFKKFFPELWRVLKQDSYFLVFGCEENVTLMKELGCYQILIWNKNHCGMGNLNDFGIGYEFLFYFKKGSPKLRGTRINGIIDSKHIGFFDDTLHPTQKPVKLLRYIIQKCTDEGQIVLDGFMGSGTTAVACVQSNRKFLGFELNPDYCRIINERLNQTSLFKYMKI